MARFLSVPSSGEQKMAFPEGFNLWDFSRFPVNVYRTGRGLYRTDFDPKATPGIKAIFDGLTTGSTKVVYADASKADNTGDGLTAATAKQSIRAAVAVGEADGSATQVLVYVRSGEYDRTRDFCGTSTSPSYTTKPTALIGYGGKVVVGPIFLGLSWSLDSGTSYKVVRSNVAKMLNRMALDARGNPTPFTRFSTKSAYDSATGVDAYFLDTNGSSSGGTTNTLYAKRGDGLPVSDTNTRVLAIADSARPGGAHFYTSGIDWYGGGSTLLGIRSSGNVTMNIAAEDCQFLYAGVDLTGTFQNAVSIDFDGICVLARCTYAYTQSDAVNPHGFYGRAHTLIIGGSAYAIGASPSVSNNLLTAHGGSGGEQATPVIAIGYAGIGSSGGAWRNVGSSQMAVFGCALDGDRGDLVFGGSVASLGASAEGGASMWLWEPTILRCLIGIQAASSSFVLVRDPIVVHGRQSSGNGTVQAF